MEKNCSRTFHIEQHYIFPFLLPKRLRSSNFSTWLFFTWFSRFSSIWQRMCVPSAASIVLSSTVRAYFRLHKWRSPNNNFSRVLVISCFFAREWICPPRVYERILNIWEDYSFFQKRNSWELIEVFSRIIDFFVICALLPNKFKR